MKQAIAGSGKTKVLQLHHQSEFLQNVHQYQHRWCHQHPSGVLKHFNKEFPCTEIVFKACSWLVYLSHVTDKLGQGYMILFGVVLKTTCNSLFSFCHPEASGDLRLLVTWDFWWPGTSGDLRLQVTWDFWWPGTSGDLRLLVTWDFWWPETSGDLGLLVTDTSFSN